MKRIIRLSESNLLKLIKTIIREQEIDKIKNSILKLNVHDVFSRKVTEAKKEAIKWWTEKLNSLKTKNRLSNFHSISDVDVENLIKKYLNLLQTFEIVIVDVDELSNNFKKASGWVFTDDDNKVFLNYRNLEDTSIKNISNVIIHELQHLLDRVEETTPYVFIKNIFSNSTPIESFNSNIVLIKSQLGVTDEESKKIVDMLESFNKEIIKKYGETYLTSPKEINARVQSSRIYFNKKVGEKITIEEIKNYLLKDREEKGSEVDLDFILAYWAHLKYPNLQEILKQLNSFVKGKTDKFGNYIV
jgi:hypothetical protein